MKETKQINLGGYALIIDEDAAMVLSEYLQQIEARLQESDSKQEIMQDIEARIVELLRQHLNYSHVEVADLRMVQNVMEQLGTPEMITEGQEEPEDPQQPIEADENCTKGSDPNVQIEPKSKCKKKLFRDPEGKSVAGVCAGLGEYFDINPMWFRLAILLSAIFMNGLGLLVYLILWIIMPEANTTARRLEMQGFDPSAENIRQEVERQKAQAQGRPYVKHQSGGSNLAGGCLIALAILCAIPLVLIVLGIIAAMVAVFVASGPIATFIGISSGSLYATAGMLFCSLMVFVLPIIILIVWGRRLNSGKPIRKWSLIVAVLLWLCTLGVTIYGRAQLISRINTWDHEEFEQRVDSLANAWITTIDVYDESEDLSE